MSSNRAAFCRVSQLASLQLPVPGAETEDVGAASRVHTAVVRSLACSQVAEFEAGFMQTLCLDLFLLIAYKLE